MKRTTAFLLLCLLIFTMACERTPPNAVRSPDDVEGKIIGALTGSPSVLLAEELGSQAYGFPTGSELMYHLKSGTVDCVIMENSVASELVSETSGVRLLSKPLLETDLCFAVAKENAELLEAVNSTLTTLRGNGTLNGLLNRYFAGRRYNYVKPADIPARPGALSLAVPPDSPPYSYKDKNDNFVGLDIDVARAVCDYLGVELVIIECETRDLVTAVWYGTADLALGWLVVGETDTIAVSDAYANAKHVVIVRR